jgi:pimeloyl-ACP methyl ester carboxylesterase
MIKTIFRVLSFKALFFCGALSATACLQSSSTTTAESAAINDQEIVAVVHGFGRSKYAMWLIAHRLNDAGYRVELIGYRSLQDTPAKILDHIGRQIGSCCIGTSRKVHFVGYSLGGLLVRAYLADKRPRNLGRVVVVGSPSKGLEIVDDLRVSWWFRFLGPTARELGTTADSFPQSIGPPSYPLGVIAGRLEPSSLEGILMEDSDGLIAIESTKVPGMSDFAIVEANHWGMRYSGEVARLVLRFLQSGHFN